MAALTTQLDRDAALAFLYGRINYERSTRIPYRSPEFKLRRMRELLDRLGNPHERLDAIHVAGTKGKGSTATMIASVLSAAGLRTGLYTSPHLDRLEQRVVIDGREIAPDQLADLVSHVKPIVEEMDRRAERGGTYRRGPTFFEITTAMAMLHFARSEVDLAVLEVGLGGRLDSTNVCRPLVSVITSISFDHTKTLGNTLAEIAFEKAGIIKPGVPVVSGVVEAEPRAVIERAARERGCTLFSRSVDFDFQYNMRRPGALNTTGAADPVDDCDRIDYAEQLSSESRRLINVSISLPGRHQAANAALAICAISRLQAAGWQVPEAAIRAGLSTARCPARIEVVGREPVRIIDSAHNVASAEALVETLEQRFDAQKRVLVFATSRDKDAAGMLRVLLPRFDRVFFTRYVENPRFAEPETLLTLGRRILRATSPQSVADEKLALCADPLLAWRLACLSAEPDDLVCVTGSVFVAAEIRPFVLQPARPKVALPHTAC